MKRRRVFRLQSVGNTVHTGGAMEAGAMAWGLWGETLKKCLNTCGSVRTYQQMFCIDMINQSAKHQEKNPTFISGLTTSSSSSSNKESSSEKDRHFYSRGQKGKDIKMSACHPKNKCPVFLSSLTNDSYIQIGVR